MNTRRAFRVLPILFACLSLALLCGCPPGPTGWTRIHGGPEDDCGYDIQQTSDGGFIVAGVTYTASAGAADMYLLKLAGNGDLMWSTTHGGAEEDIARRVLALSDGSYVMAGSTESFGAGMSDACLVKVDSDGGLVWNRTYGTAKNELIWGLAQTSDSGFMLVGGVYDSQTRNRDLLLVKTDNDGNEEWSQALDYEVYDEAFGVLQATDGGYAIVGVSSLSAEEGSVMLLVKTDEDGVPEWNRRFGETALGFDIRQTSDGGYIMAGVENMWSVSSVLMSDPWEQLDGYMVKTDADGVEEWSHVLDSPRQKYYLRSVRQTTEGGYIFSGDVGQAALLMKIAPNGVEQWSRTYGGGSSSDSFASAAIEPASGGFCFAGMQYRHSSGDSAVYVVRTDALGAVGGPLPVAP